MFAIWLRVDERKVQHLLLGEQNERWMFVKWLITREKSDKMLCEIIFFFYNIVHSNTIKYYSSGLTHIVTHIVTHIAKQNEVFTR